MKESPKNLLEIEKNRRRKLESVAELEESPKNLWKNRKKISLKESVNQNKSFSFLFLFEIWKSEFVTPSSPKPSLVTEIKVTFQFLSKKTMFYLPPWQQPQVCFTKNIQHLSTPNQRMLESQEMCSSKSLSLFFVGKK